MKFTTSCLLTLLCLFKFYAQDGRDINAFPYNSKNCIMQQSDGNFFVGGVFRTIYFPFYDTKISVVNNNISENASLTGYGNFTYPDLDEVNAVEKYYNVSSPQFYRYVGGNFPIYGGVSVNGLMRIKTDGSIDPTFAINNTTPFSPVIVRAIVEQANGKVIVGGSFTNYMSTSKNRIMRLNENGTIDNTFSVGTGFDGSVYAIKIQSDGKIIVGGDFTSYNGVSRSRIARLNSDGTLDTTFNINYPVDKVIRTVLILSDGKLLIGGDFDIVGECVAYDIPTSACIVYNIRRRIAKLNTDGTLDQNFMSYFSSQRSALGFFKPYTYNGVTTNIASVNTISEYSSGKYFIGGEFEIYHDSARRNVCLLNTNGALDASFNPSPGPDGDVRGAIVEPSGNVVIVGNFWRFNGIIKNGMARLSPAGTTLRMSPESDLLDADLTISTEKDNEKKQDNIAMYPNPTKDRILITSKSKIQKIEVMSLEGTTMQTEYNEGTESMTLDLSAYRKGIYILKIQTDNFETFMEKVIRN